jgi:hypothetical protein
MANKSGKPAYELRAIKLAFNSVNKLNMTVSAMQGQYALGFSDQDVVDAIQSLTSADFYKSMRPTHHEFLAGQDVYKSVFKSVTLYIKFQVDSRGEVVVSFKAR